MENDKLNWWGPVRDPWATYNSTVGALALPVGAYVYAFFWRGPAPEFAVGVWAAFYLLNIPFQVWHVAVRPEGGNPGWAAKVLFVGAWPYAYFALLWPQLTTRIGLLVMFPIIAASGFAAIWIAEFKGRRGAPDPPQPPDSTDPA
jgi:hypothetical protein